MSHAHHHDRSHPEHHGHSEGGHSHAPATFNRAFAIGIVLNSLYIVVQVVFGIISHSLALLADAGHNVSDVLGLGLAWGASYLATKPPSSRYTYGLRKTSVIAALANAMFLLIAVGGISWEAVQRFSERGPVAGGTVMLVAALGIVVNAGTAMLFMSGQKGDLNIRGAFLHMAADAAVSAGVVVAGFAIQVTGWHWLDPAASLAINAIIVVGTWSLLRDSFKLSIDAVPSHIDSDAVRDYLAKIPGVTEVHDLHIWGMSTTESALTVHLVIPNGISEDVFLHRVAEEIREKFKIGHSTIQIERGDSGTHCRLAPADAV